MDKDRYRKAAEAASLSRTGSAILNNGERLGVQWIAPSQGLGYTQEKPCCVNVAWTHPLFSGMIEDEVTLMHMGIFAHELLHQCLTNFAYTNRICRELPPREQMVFMKFANTLEDPAIEFLAPAVFGGTLLDALRFSIRQIYMKSPAIGKERDAFTQLINALIHFGDMGLIKGKFTFPEARKYFKKVAPLYNKGIECPDNEERLEIAKECMEICRPLWEEELQKHEELCKKLSKELAEALKRHGRPSKEDVSMPPKEDGDDSSERRSSLLIKIKKEEKRADDSEDDDSKNSEGSDDEAKGDSEGEGSDDEAKGDSEGEGSDDEAEGDSEGEGSDDEAKGDSEGEGSDDEAKGDSEGEGSESGDSPKSTTTSDDEFEPLPDDDDLCLSEDEVADFLDDFKELSDEVKEELEKLRKETEKREIEEKREGEVETLPTFDISSPAFKKASLYNRAMRPSPEMHQYYLTEYNWDIKCLTKTLDAVFESIKDEPFRATSGSYNIKRGAIGTSARIFDKRREKGNAKDIAVMLAVDLSGSMGGQNIEAARKASIVFAEALTALKIPYYVMGYAGDDHCQADHYHFVTWKNTKKQRESLGGMECYWNNFDGYSIRYATELLKAKNAGRKILFVISDGVPCCKSYHNISVGIADTVMAIKDAKKSCDVFGIGLGEYCSPDILQSMYGKDFIHCADTKLLTQTLCKQLKKTFQR